jgi:hypothetical protein
MLCGAAKYVITAACSSWHSRRPCDRGSTTPPTSSTTCAPASGSSRARANLCITCRASLPPRPQTVTTAPPPLQVRVPAAAGAVQSHPHEQGPLSGRRGAAGGWVGSGRVGRGRLRAVYILSIVQCIHVENGSINNRKKPGHHRTLLYYYFHYKQSCTYQSHARPHCLYNYDCADTETLHVTWSSNIFIYLIEPQQKAVNYTHLHTAIT